MTQSATLPQRGAAHQRTNLIFEAIAALARVVHKEGAAPTKRLPNPFHPSESPMRVLLLLAFALPLSLTVACKRPVADVADATTGGAPRTAVADRASVESRMAGNFERVYFDLDADALGSEAKGALADNAKIMADFPDVRVEVQGHADERGTTEYNIALDQRRAQAVRTALLGSGVAGSRVTTVSFGEERPAVAGSGESYWSKNRRAEFRVVWGEGVAGTTP
jgi:peptidoglycan-associated lipoprotein